MNALDPLSGISPLPTHSSPDILCLGELLIDFVSTDRDVDLSHSGGFVKAPGGAPANVAVSAVRMGSSAGFIGKVGDDPFGHYLRSVLEKNGVDASHLVMDAQARTTLSFVAQKSDGVRDCIFYRNPGADQLLAPEELDPSYIAAARIFHYGSISLEAPLSQAATVEAVRLAREKGLLLTYDPNYRPTLWGDQEEARKKMDDALCWADLVKISEEEYPFITGAASPEACGRYILERGPSVAVVTLGERGCYYTDGTNSGYLSGCPVRLVDTTGAGDSFVGTVLAHLAQRRREDPSYRPACDEAFVACLRLANCAGALATTRLGAIPSIPTKEQAAALLVKR